jgi:ATP-dependent Clp protease ATP-binding subunit ClpA
MNLSEWQASRDYIMSHDQEVSNSTSTKGPRVFIIVERIAPGAYRARTLPPWSLDELGSREKEVVLRVRNKLPHYFKKMKPVTWARPLPGNNPLLQAPSVLQIKTPLRLADIRGAVDAEVDIDIVTWQVDAKNFAYFVPALDRTWLGRPTQWDESSLQRRLQKEIEKRVADKGLEFLYDLIAVRSIKIHSAQFPAESITSLSGNQVKKKKADLRTLKKIASDVRTWKEDPVFERDELVTRLADIVTAELPQSVLLVGPPGVGKTALVRQIPKSFPRMPPLWSTGGSQIVSGMCGMGMWQERLQQVLGEARKINAVLHFGSLFELMEAGKLDDQPGVSSFLKPEMQRGKIRVIAECTTEQYQQIESQDPSLLRCFLRVDVDELDREANLRLLQKISELMIDQRIAELSLEGGLSRIEIEPGVIERLDELCRRYCAYSTMPGIPLRLLRGVLGAASAGEVIHSSVITRAFSSQTGLPVFLIDDDVPLLVNELEENLRRRVVGQEEPVELLANMISTLKSRLNRTDRPLSSFLFIGPTGVGKTEMAKALAEILFGDASRMTRLDMSEYATPWSLGRLTGIHSKDSGTLTGPILDQPFAVILLDEIEKAHPSVFDLLLQVLGEGRLTDAAGRKADFRSAVIIMTSNLGVESFKATGTGFIGGGEASYREHFEREVRRYVRPELLGRLDRIVPFSPLSREHVQSIAEREVGKLWRRPGVRYSRMQVNVASDVLLWLAEKGYQPQYGARPLRRVVEESIAIPLARFMQKQESQLGENAKSKIVSIAMEGELPHIKMVEEDELRESSVAEPVDEEHVQLHAPLVDEWRELRYKAWLVSQSSAVRWQKESLYRLDTKLKAIERKILKSQKAERTSILIQQQGVLLSQKKEIEDRLDRLKQIQQRIHNAWHEVIKAFYLGATVSKTFLRSKCAEMEKDLRKMIADLQYRESRSSVWTLIYIGGDLPDFRFLYEAHHKRFRSTSRSWLLYTEKKFAKLKKSGFFPEGSVLESNTTIFKEAEIVAVRQFQGLININYEYAIGMVSEFQPAGDRIDFINEEAGIHILKRLRGTTTPHKSRLRVEAFESRLEQMKLSSGFCELNVAVDTKPHRVYSESEGFVEHIPNRVVQRVGAGTLEGAVDSLLERIEEQAVWNRFGYIGVPQLAKAVQPLFLESSFKADR